MQFRSKNLWIIHVLGWVLFLSLSLTVVSRGMQEGFPLTFLTSGKFWLFLFVFAAIFYFNLLFLLPKLFVRQKYLLYTAVFVVGLAGIYFLQPFEKLIFRPFQQNEIPPGEMRQGPPPMNFREMPPPAPRYQSPRVTVDFVSLVLFLVVWIVGMSVKLSEQWRNSERRAAQSEAEKAQAELSFFKAQINPHFLFNTLNNIYALAVSQHEHTAPSILKLSQMMRYVTEEATADYVPLEDEIACLENYIDLQRLRLNAKTRVNFIVTGNMQQVKIAPLILMTFVENAFKYGVSGHFDAQINIEVHAADGNIDFLCQNKNFDPKTEAVRTGVGIANTRKRLDYLYPNRHSLRIETEAGLFTVNLKLKPA